MSTNQPNLFSLLSTQLESILALRCQEVAALLKWPLRPPTLRLVTAETLGEAVEADVRTREEQARGGPRRAGWLEQLASWAASISGPPTLGYFATSRDTLFLNGELVPMQASYVLLHELVHAAQWQNHPRLFEQIDRTRVQAADLAAEHGAEHPAAQVARDRYESLVTFLEGHATLIGRRGLEQRIARELPDLPVADAHALVRELMALDPEDEVTQFIYVRGETTLGRFSLAQLEALYQDPELIVGFFTRHRAT